MNRRALVVAARVAGALAVAVTAAAATGRHNRPGAYDPRAYERPDDRADAWFPDVPIQPAADLGRSGPAPRFTPPAPRIVSPPTFVRPWEWKPPSGVPDYSYNRPRY